MTVDFTVKSGMDVPIPLAIHQLVSPVRKDARKPPSGALLCSALEHLQVS